MLKLKTSVDLAAAMVDNLAVLDSVGYGQQGHHSQSFLRDISEGGEISQESLYDYLHFFKDAFVPERWFNAQAAEKAKDYIVALTAFALETSTENARIIIDWNK